MRSFILHYFTLHYITSPGSKVSKMTVGYETSHTNIKTHIQYI
jgi:hypothetical protein